MEESMTRLSSKGQVVIPHEIREEFHLKEGTPFSVVAQKDTILLKRIEAPKIKSWDEATKPFRAAAQKSGLQEADLERLISEARKAGK